MKKYLLLLGALISLNFASQAAPGDTTWVQATSTWFTHYGSFDTTIHFPAPGTSYRNVYMIFTLGKYSCGGSGYCGDWDYTVQNYVMTPGGDTLELGRFITPYANAGAPRTPFTWTQHYVYDVTDYAKILHDSATIRVFYSGYSWGFSGDIKFAFVEGTPARDVKGVEHLWHGSFNYGVTPDINTYFPAVSRTAPAGSVGSSLKFTVTGHGADPNYCCEFMSHNYDVLLNTSSIATTAIWKMCGMNELYPQSGTWLYDRANWCPGELTQSRMFDLAGTGAGSSFNVGLQFEPYTKPAGSGQGSYTTEATLFYYGSMNKTLDVSVDDIISPTNNENHFRENPICSNPSIKIKNTGSTAITSVALQYGVVGSTLQSYTWNGTLPSLADTTIVLPDLTSLHDLSGTTAANTFIVQVNSVNGTADADATNDTMRSTFVPTPQWDSHLRIEFRTNNEETSSGSGVSETNWEILDASNTVVYSRVGAPISTLVKDTIWLGTGCYKLVITDGSCNGLHWWANPSGVTAGSLLVKKQSTGAPYAMNGWVTSGQYSYDFGCSYTQNFTVVAPAAVTELNKEAASIDAYPNPARNSVTVSLNGVDRINGTLQVIDMLGRVVAEQACNSTTTTVNVADLANGVYTVRFVDPKSNNKLQARLIIAK